MVQTVIAAYLIGWALSAVVIYMASRHMGSKYEPVPHQFALSAGAGALWPLLILGAVEFSSVAAASSAASHVESVDGSSHHLLVSATVVPLR
ncbi:hypothetical protein [Mycolicibacterium fluoranthenivorans]|uniref:Uncharacterized protein n=1 Tax=Mycolicibacterium fluoranthenivorans TaxID=258505 RepID=A0A7X5U4L3_9MYCO|nr:hypothetical protein [Mycolicibacterium fluoranthenivorans]MCV7355338.1 hypothetical protein [Mycolicibacterium fluoranthenivorans]NIH98273.1 hypothetical protein [Mycolicibacterium fluoranthenivorans]